MNKISLRDMKKEATMHALADAAFELALERGLDHFVVEDIVQRAGYSRRTFANYFSCKEEAVAMATVTLQGSQEVEDWIASLPEDAHPLEILYQLMKMRLTANVLHRLHKLESLSKRYPSLEPYILSVLRRVQMEAQQLLHELSRGRYPDGYSHLLAGAVFGAVLPLLDGSLNVLLPGQSATEASGAITFDEYLDATFGYLRNGF